MKGERVLEEKTRLCALASDGSGEACAADCYGAAAVKRPRHEGGDELVVDDDGREAARDDAQRQESFSLSAAEVGGSEGNNHAAGGGASRIRRRRKGPPGPTERSPGGPRVSRGPVGPSERRPTSRACGFGDKQWSGVAEHLKTGRTGSSAGSGGSTT